MALFEWNQSYSVGVEHFDRQHQNLIGLLNELYEAMKVGKAAEALGPIFNSLVEYTGYHFSAEEKAMAKYACGDLTTHREEHARLTEKVLEYKRKFEAKQVLLSVELLEFLKTWLAHHILETDKKYGSLLADKDLS